MDLEQTTHNYHASLTTVKEDLDPLLKILKDKSTDGWFWKALTGPLKSFLALVKKAKAVPIAKAAGLLSLPTIGPFLAGLVAYWNHLPDWMISLISGVLVIGVYAIYVLQYMAKMVVPGNPEFHIGLFKKKRKIEYEKYWKRLTQIDDFNFEGLQNLVGSIFGVQTAEQSELIRYLKVQLEKQEEELKKYEQQFDEYEVAIESFAFTQEKSDQEISNLMDVIKDLNISLYRLANGCITYSDLTFISGITIYREETNRLVKIVDERTTGISPAVIDLDDAQYQNYAVVSASRQKARDPVWTTPYAGHIILAYRMKMFNDEVWILSFHLDERNEKALSLLLDSDMIEISEIYRMFHALCLILQSSKISKKDGANPDEPTSNAR